VTSVALVLRASAKAWELRGAWATGHRVSVSLDVAELPRVEGHVARVSATDAYVVITGRHIPLDRVLAVHRPSLLGDSTCRDPEKAWTAPIPAALRVHAGQLHFAA